MHVCSIVDFGSVHEKETWLTFSTTSADCRPTVSDGIHYMCYIFEPRRSSSYFFQMLKCHCSFCYECSKYPHSNYYYSKISATPMYQKSQTWLKTLEMRAKMLKSCVHNASELETFHVQRLVKGNLVIVNTLHSSQMYVCWSHRQKTRIIKSKQLFPIPRT